MWVEGDHPQGEKTLDSNHFGPVAQNLIVGRVGGVVLPWSRRRKVEEEWGGCSRVREARPGDVKVVKMMKPPDTDG